MLIMVGVACSLFSAAPQPAKSSTGFFIGGVLATLAAYVCNFYVLSSVSGFPLFALAMGVFVLPGALAFANPNGIGLAYCVNLLVLSRPLNPMDYDAVSFLNNAMGTLIGLGFGIMAYLLFIPPDPLAARRYVVYRIRVGLRNISRMNPVPPPWRWQTRMFDRVNRLHDPKNPAGWPTDEWFNGGLAALNLGNEVLRLRHLLEEARPSPAESDLARAVLKSFREIVDHPEPIRLTIQAAREALQYTGRDVDDEGRLRRSRLLGIFEEMEAFFVAHPGFLTP